MHSDAPMLLYDSKQSLPKDASRQLLLSLDELIGLAVFVRRPAAGRRRGQQAVWNVWSLICTISCWRRLVKVQQMMRNMFSSTNAKLFFLPVCTWTCVRCRSEGPYLLRSSSVCSRCCLENRSLLSSALSLNTNMSANSCSNTRQTVCAWPAFTLRKLNPLTVCAALFGSSRAQTCRADLSVTFECLIIRFRENQNQNWSLLSTIRTHVGNSPQWEVPDIEHRKGK